MEKNSKIIFYVGMTIVIVGTLITHVLSLKFIGENEQTIHDYISFSTALWIAIPILVFFSFLQIRYKLIIQVSYKKWRPLKILSTVIFLPIFSILISYAFVFISYSSINRILAGGDEVLSGEIYKIEKKKIDRGPDHFYIYFNESEGYAMRVKKIQFVNQEIGDSIIVKVQKGKFEGYYLLKK